MGAFSRTRGERATRAVLWIYTGLVLLFLTLPIVIIIPLSFNAEPYFTVTEGMLNLDAQAFSWRWYIDILQNGMIDPSQPTWSWSWLKDAWQNAQWIHAARNSLAVGVGSTVLSTILGTLAALGLSHPRMPARALISSILIAPMVVPIIISSAGIFFFFSQIGLTNTYIGLVLAHSVLGTPFVIITVAATLSGFDTSLIRAGRVLGAAPHIVFWRVIGPLILPGLVSGALFAFIASFDEVVMVIFLADYDQRTIPRQMWSGVREQISPTILAVATILVVLSVIMLATVELLRRRSERMRGLRPR